MTAADVAERLLQGEPRAIARAISIVENEDAEAAALIGRIFGTTGRAYVIGVTGPPGAGKSTLVDRLIEHVRAGGQSVGVIAVDPTSPFSGGAVLGDRVRMQRHSGDANVFVRSMATRGHLGGLSRTTSDAVLVLDAAGKDIVIIETVGVGQDEVDIIRAADIALVTLVPGTGDEVQAIKAGIMEIADVFVVNKADREGADRLVSAIAANLSLHAYGAADWQPPIVKTVATDGAGIGDLAAAIARFRQHTQATTPARRRQRAEYRLRELVAQGFLAHLEQRVLRPGELSGWIDRISARDIDPYAAADALLQRAVGDAAGQG